MKIETQELEDHHVKLTVEIGPEPMEKAKRQAARRISRNMKIPGFRPGKAPYGVVVRHVGEGAILEDALDILLKDVYPQVIEEAEIEPYGPGSLENFSTDPPTFEFVVPLKAEVDLGDYKSVRLPYEPPKVSDDDLYENLQNLRERYAYLKSVERPAEEDDLVHIILSSQRTQGEGESVPDEGEEDTSEDPTQMENVTTSVEIAPEGDEDDDWPFPGFSRNLIGLTPEDEKAFTYTYPDNHEDEDLRGVEAEFQVRIDSIQTRILPDLDDEFAQMVSDFDTMDAYRKDMRTNMERQRKTEYDDNYDDQILESIVADSAFKYASVTLEDEIEDMKSNLERQLSEQNLDLEMYYQISDTDEESLHEELKPAAEDRIKQDLVLMKVAEEEDIQVDPQEVKEETDRVVEALKQILPSDQARDLDSGERYSNVLTNVWVDMLKKQTVERLRSITKGEAPLEGEDETEPENIQSEGETHKGETVQDELSLASLSPETEVSGENVETQSTTEPEEIEAPPEEPEPEAVKPSDEGGQSSDTFQEEE